MLKTTCHCELFKTLNFGMASKSSFIISFNFSLHTHIRVKKLLKNLRASRFYLHTVQIWLYVYYSFITVVLICITPKLSPNSSPLSFPIYACSMFNCSHSRLIPPPPGLSRLCFRSNASFLSELSLQSFVQHFSNIINSILMCQNASTENANVCYVFKVFQQEICSVKFGRNGTGRG